MKKAMRKIIRGFRKKPFLVMALCSLAFAISILFLFTREKEKLDMEYGSMIADSLSIHTKHHADDIGRAIADADRAVRAAGAILQLVENGEPQVLLEQNNIANPDYIIHSLTEEEMQAGALSAFVPGREEEAHGQLLRGETVVSDITYVPALDSFALAVLAPPPQKQASGALYTYIHADQLLPPNLDSAVYQDVQSSIITGSGEVIFNNYEPSYTGNFFAALSQYELTQKSVDSIVQIIRTPEMDGATFLRHGQTYYVCAAALEHNGWCLVSIVRGPDVLLRSTNIFRDVVHTGVIAILITAAAACVIFLQLLSSRKLLKKEQRRNQSLMRRLQAMFNQHSALKLVIDMQTHEIVSANPSACSYFGVPIQEMLGRKLEEFSLLSDDDFSRRLQNVSDGKAMFFAAPHRLASGEIKLLDVYASIIRDGGREFVYAILFDSTDRERYRDELLREKELLRTTLQSIGDGVVTTDNSGIITSLNAVAEKITGWSTSEAIGTSFTEVFVLQKEDTGEPVENPIRKVLDTGRIIGLANHTELVDRRGARIPIADSAAPIKAQDGEAFGVVMVFRDVSEEKEHSRQMQFLGYHDPLTGLHNRRYLEKAVARMESEGVTCATVIIADVDGLKITNDVFGHQAGDALLQSVAGLLRRCCPQDALIARWGGDEFVILMPGTGQEEAEAVIGRIKTAEVTIEGINLALSLSLGCACTDAENGDISLAMQQAEKYMYQQKLLNGKSYRNAIISTLLATLYEKSTETQEHSKRLEAYCHAIGRMMGLSSREMDELSLLALLHDIGKVGINHSILQKPGALTPAEWEEMKRHPEIGYRIAQGTPELAGIADFILSHHERWDGGGYPRGLRAQAIPLICRILAVVDAFDAMTNDRAYRRAASVEEALLEIEQNAGKQFDPQIAMLFIEIVIKEEEERLGTALHSST